MALASKRVEPKEKPAAEDVSETKLAEPVAQPAAKPAKKPVSLDWLIIFLSLVVLGAAIGWGILQMNASSPSDTSSSQQAVVPTPTPLPTLALNASHQRQGEAIRVDPSAFGNSNPFSTP